MHNSFTGNVMPMLKIKANLNNRLEFAEEAITIAGGMLTVTGKDGVVFQTGTKEIENAFVEEGLGVCKLVIKTKGGTEKEISYFTKSHFKNFKKFADAINQYIVKNRTVKTSFETRERKAGGISTIYWLYGFMAKYKKMLIVGAVLSVVMIGLNLVPPYMLKILIDNVILSQTHSQQLFEELTIILLASYAASTAISGIQSYVLTKTGNQIVTELRSRLFRHAVKLSATDIDNVTPSRIQSRLISDAGNTQWLMTYGLSTVITNALTIIGIGVILFLLFPSLALYVLVPIPFIIFIIMDYNKRADVIYYKSWRRSADLITKINDVIPSYTIVKSANKENFEGGEFDSGLDKFYNSEIGISKMELKHWQPIGFLVSISTVIIWWIGGGSVIAGTLQLGIVTAFLAYMGMFYGPIQQISSWMPYIQQSVTSAERLREVFDSDDTGREPHGKELADINKDIKFQNVWFGYDPLFPIIKGANTTIKRGEITSIVGKSGAGKSTVAKLLLGLYSIDEGDIKFGNTSINSIDVGHLRGRISYVPQDSMFFDNTIAYNLMYFSKLDADPIRLIAATKAVEMYDEIMKFPLRYDNRIRSRGMSLSGGQRQRLAVARAILGDPDIVVLDEITANLDAINARKVNHSLLSLESDKTMVFVTHDFSEIINSDFVVVLEDGKVVEQGKPSKLIRRRGKLYKMFKYRLNTGSKSKPKLRRKSLESFVSDFVVEENALAIGDGERKSFVNITYKGRHMKRLIPKKPFPISNPKMIVFYGKHDKDLFVIRDYNNLAKESREVLERALEVNSFNPRVTSIRSVRITGDGLEWVLETDKGTMKFVTRNRQDIITTGDYTVLIDEFNTPLKIDTRDLDKQGIALLNDSI